MGIKRSVTVSSGVMGMLLFLLVPEETSDVGTPMSVWEEISGDLA